MFINYLSATFSKDCEKATDLCFWLLTYLAPYFLTVKNCYHQFKSKNQLPEKNFSLVFRAVYIDEYQVQNSYDMNDMNVALPRLLRILRILIIRFRLIRIETL